MINFSSFADELIKIAQTPDVGHLAHPKRRNILRGVSAAAGAGLGLKGALETARKMGPRGRVAAGIVGATLGGLGGERVGKGLHRALG